MRKHALPRRLLAMVAALLICFSFLLPATVMAMDAGAENGRFAMTQEQANAMLSRKEGTGGGGYGIRHQHTPYPVHLTVLIHHIGLQRDSYHGAYGVEEIHKEEGYHHDKHVPREDMTPLELKEYGCQRGRCGEELTEMGHAHRDTDERRQQDPPEESSPDIPYYHQSTEHKSDERQQHRGTVKVREAHLRTLVGNDDAAVLQTDEGDEKSYTASDGRLHTCWNGVRYQLPDFEEREEDKEDSLDEDCRQRELPTVAHPQTDGKDEKGVDAHTRCQSERLLGIERHHQRSDDGCQEDAGVHGQDIGHGEESSEPGIDLRSHLMLCRVEPE